MESRNIALTLEKAREWYNSGSADLREVALQAYTRDELEIPEWKNIKTFEDACRALGMDTPYVKTPSFVDGLIVDHLWAVCKLDIIRKALNGDWKPSMIEGTIYYPHVRLYPDGQTVKSIASSYNWKLGGSFIAEGKRYILVGGDCHYSGGGGLISDSFGYGEVLPNLGLLGCKSREIAKHMSHYFSKEIFEATYAHHVGTYQ